MQSVSDIIEAISALGNVETPPVKPVWTNIPQVPVTDDDVAKCRDAILNALGGDPVEIDDPITLVRATAVVGVGGDP